MAWADAEQAVQVARFGPLAPNRIDTCPDARLMIADGMKNGEILPRTAVEQRLVLALDGRESADAGSEEDADVGGVGRRDPQARVVHGELRGRDGVLDEDVHLLDVFLLDELQRVEALDLGGNLRGKAADVELRNPGDAARPATSADQLALVPIPSDDTRPMPVMTTRLFNILLIFNVPIVDAWADRALSTWRLKMFTSFPWRALRCSRWLP